MSFQKEVRKNPRISADVAAHACRNGRKRIAERTSKQKITSAASIRLMSALPEQPERLVEILRELIALSKTEGNHSELAPANGPTKLLDARERGTPGKPRRLGPKLPQRAKADCARTLDAVASRSNDPFSSDIVRRYTARARVRVELCGAL